MTQLASMGGDTAADFDAGPGGETIAPEAYTLGDAPGPLDPDALRRLDAWWRAANYLAVGQIYLTANALQREPLQAEHVKARLLGHFGTVPGLNLVHVHANRLIRERDLNAVFVAGPGHGGPGPNACAWLEGSYSEHYSHIPRDLEGMTAFFRQFSYPGGVPSHCAPETPGSFHEGGELGYSLVHAFGAALDNPDLTVFCVVGDGEAETGPLATSWHGNKFLDPVRDGAVLPILALNEYKIANPTILARIPQAELEQLMRGYGYAPRFVTGRDPAQVHQDMAAAMQECLDEIADIQQAARSGAGGGAGPPRPPARPYVLLTSAPASERGFVG
jgi:xylulose-5-phosphate/fructose-6-phosphate phosphoketolase